MIQGLKLELKREWGFKCINYQNKRESRERKRKLERETMTKGNKIGAEKIWLVSVRDSFYY